MATSMTRTLVASPRARLSITEVVRRSRCVASTACNQPGRPRLNDVGGQRSSCICAEAEQGNAMPFGGENVAGGRGGGEGVQGTESVLLRTRPLCNTILGTLESTIVKIRQFSTHNIYS